MFRYIHSNGRYGSTRVGVSGPKEGDEVGEQRHARGDIGGYPIPYEKLANTKIPSCQKSTKYDTAFIFGLAYLKLYPSRVFVYLKHLCTSNQPRPLRGNVRRPRIDRYND